MDSPMSGRTPSSHHFLWEEHSLVINNVNLSIFIVRRDGPLDPILFLYGFGSTKEDFTDIIHYAPLSDYPFLSSFIERTRRSADYENGIYAASFRSKVSSEVVRPPFQSMVIYTDNGDLLNVFEAVPCPKMFMFGVSYNKLSYLPRIAQAGVKLAEIPDSGHFVMYTNPTAVWKRIQEFVGMASGRQKHLRSNHLSVCILTSIANLSLILLHQQYKGNNVGLIYDLSFTLIKLIGQTSYI
ncbi:hypothetical protein BDP81DRAFT_499558 [Colletotrichum phormii]|uniref:Uncharacterized protein n=1 Tax=Colletotrichum phormii TaxID=359342 RepID=A0AAI9ZJ37_9PEZI|nr:uncharacterized protein BDP81DRAFT_499558 [Colletotrichum phormii]KAK1625153.1 hypothetical protein BDP81DRAFT_499558 [Colletotrichum phormii]